MRAKGPAARTPPTKPGFHRLLAEVSMDYVGLILGLGMSRLARCGTASASAFA